MSLYLISSATVSCPYHCAHFKVAIVYDYQHTRTYSRWRKMYSLHPRTLPIFLMSQMAFFTKHAHSSSIFLEPAAPLHPRAVKRHNDTLLFIRKVV